MEKITFLYIENKIPHVIKSPCSENSFPQGFRGIFFFSLHRKIEKGQAGVKP
jgi:hypothetical protein